MRTLRYLWVSVSCAWLVGCVDDVTSDSQQALRPFYDVTVDCDQTLDDVGVVQSAVDRGIGQITWAVKVVGTCQFEGSQGGLYPEPIPCNAEQDCPQPIKGGTRSCDQRDSAPTGYIGFCFVHVDTPQQSQVILANADPFARATNAVFITSSVTLDGHGATIVGGALVAGWDGDLIFGGFEPTLPDLVAGIPAAPVHPVRPAPAHWDRVSYGVDLTARYGARWARAYPDIDVTIRGFHFDSTSTIIGAARNVVFEDNVSHDLQSRFYDVWYKPGAVLRASGVTMGGLLLPPWLNIQTGDLVSGFQPTGHVAIRRNYIDTVAENHVDVSLAYDSENEPLGIATVFSNAKIEISDNTIKNVSFRNDDADIGKGIMVIDNIGTTVVEHNALEKISQYGIYDWSYALPSNHAIITHNVISDCSAAGIGSERGSNGEYRHNRIHVTNARASCIDLRTASATHVGQNICSGSGEYALFLSSSDRNTFVGNNLASFAPGTAHIRLEHSSYNVFIGYSGTISADASSSHNTFSTSEH